MVQGDIKTGMNMDVMFRALCGFLDFVCTDPVQKNGSFFVV
jgi:hypothetical protein